MTLSHILRRFALGLLLLGATSSASAQAGKDDPNAASSQTSSHG